MPRTPRTPNPGPPDRAAALELDPTGGDDGATHDFWAFVIARRIVQPSDNDDAGWRDLFARFDREGAH